MVKASQNGNFTGKAVFKFPFDYADYENGLIEITPAPSKVLPGLVVEYDGVVLNQGQVLQVTATLKKKPDLKTLNQAFIPVLKSIEKNPGVSETRITERQKASNAQNNSILVYVAIIVLALISMALIFKKKFLVK